MYTIIFFFFKDEMAAHADAVALHSTVLTRKVVMHEGGSILGVKYLFKHSKDDIMSFVPSILYIVLSG